MFGLLRRRKYGKPSKVPLPVLEVEEPVPVDPNSSAMILSKLPLPNWPRRGNFTSSTKPYSSNPEKYRYTATYNDSWSTHVAFTSTSNETDSKSIVWTPQTVRVTTLCTKTDSWTGTNGYRAVPASVDPEMSSTQIIKAWISLDPSAQELWNLYKNTMLPRIYYIGQSYVGYTSRGKLELVLERVDIENNSIIIRAALVEVGVKGTSYY
ncbi:hypothetical protein BJ508DRAFT_301882 [Ascobolus immersus RN42]|uniref:Uncharacterized protein n=1 Tax=Ascobolus immersus RN42 TaxID=1160509 RepID=A0A3N4IKW9_ASCIM|nr:hypothetical protein BJ508DRAFT_301882 [Ascobolus immersus RN42]